MKYTPAEIETARAFQKQHFHEMMTASSTPETIQETLERMNKWSPIPAPYTPTWWEQAVMWADTRQIWIQDLGWMSEGLWGDLRNMPV